MNSVCFFPSKSTVCWTQPYCTLHYFQLQYNTKTYFSPKVMKIHEWKFHKAQTRSSNIVFECDTLCHTSLDEGEHCIVSMTFWFVHILQYLVGTLLYSTVECAISSCHLVCWGGCLAGLHRNVTVECSQEGSWRWCSWLQYAGVTSFLLFLIPEFLETLCT